MSTSNDEIFAREASEATQRRKALQHVKVEISPHLSNAIDEVEKLRGIAHVIARRHNMNPKTIWEWVVKELCLAD